MIPAALRERPQWIVWKYAKRGAKWTKILYSPHTGAQAASDAPATWAGYQEATEALGRGGYDGVGYVFSADDPFVGVDLDDVRNSETGDLEQWAEKIVAALDSFTEVSPSGTGLHIFVRGDLPPHGRRKGQIEMYSAGRFFTVTGERVQDTPETIQERGLQLASLHRKVFGEPGLSGNGHPESGTGNALTDQEIVARAGRSKNGPEFLKLWSGEIDGHGSHSEADLALASHLAFWTGGDPARVDTLFRQSGLYRPKWDRKDYRERTINAALSGMRDFYKTGPKTGGEHASAHAKPGDAKPGGESPHLTDMGNAERLAARHGGDLRYVHAWGSWLVWNGKRWEPDDAGEVERRAKETVRTIYSEAADAEDSQQRKAIAAHAKQSESRARLEAMISLAASEPGIPVRPADLDADPWTLNAANGTLDLRTGDLRDHGRADLITKLAPVAYDPDAAAPTWTTFLERILPGEELRRFVQKATGYSATGDTRERVLLLLHGLGKNGKSTFLEAIREALGDEEGYAQKTPAETLMAKPSGGIPNDVARLKGARFVSASETGEGRRLDEALVKELTGNDTISARFMRAEWFDFRPSHKTWLATNHKPVIKGTDPAIWDRVKLVPFEERIPESEQDRNLPTKLREEMAGILAWIVQGCLDWQREGLSDPDEVRAATAGYRAEQDILGGFIEECCTVHGGAWCKFAHLYDNYARWCEESGEKAQSKRDFGNALSERGYEADKGGKNVSIRRGIALRSGDDPPGGDGPGGGSGEGNPEGPRVTQDFPATGSGASNKTENTSRGSNEGNPVTHGLPSDNPDNPDMYRENPRWVTQGYPKTGINGVNISHVGITGNQGNLDNPGNPEADGKDPWKLRQTSSVSTERRLTEAETVQVQRLIRSGMEPGIARAEVLGGD